MQIKQIVGENIARRRAELELTRRALGTKAGGIDATSIYKWERGLHRPADESLAALASALGRDVAWFFAEHPEHARSAAA